jgi:hypothetical protein
LDLKSSVREPGQSGYPEEDFLAASAK